MPSRRDTLASRFPSRFAPGNPISKRRGPWPGCPCSRNFLGKLAPRRLFSTPFFCFFFALRQRQTTTPTPHRPHIDAKPTPHDPHDPRRISNGPECTPNRPPPKNKRRPKITPPHIDAKPAPHRLHIDPTQTPKPTKNTPTPHRPQIDAKWTRNRPRMESHGLRIPTSCPSSLPPTPSALATPDVEIRASDRLFLIALFCFFFRFFFHFFFFFFALLSRGITTPAPNRPQADVTWTPSGPQIDHKRATCRPQVGRSSTPNRPTIDPTSTPNRPHIDLKTTPAQDQAD